MSEIAIGIDLGTSNSCVAVHRGGNVEVLANAYGEPITASVVALNEDGSIAVGNAAKANVIHDPHNTIYSAKRLMGRRFGLSTTVVLVSLVFWGWIWGALGMILSVPLTMTLRIALEHSSNHAWVAGLLGRGPVRPPPAPLWPYSQWPGYGIVPSIPPSR